MDSLFQRLLDVSSHSLTKYISAFVILGRERTQGNCFPHVLSSFDFVLDSMSFCSFSLSFSRFTLTFYFASKKCCKWMRTNHRRMKWIKSSCQEEEDEEEKEKREKDTKREQFRAVLILNRTATKEEKLNDVSNVAWDHSSLVISLFLFSSS